MKFNFLTKEFFDKYKECLELEKKEIDLMLVLH